MKKSYLNSERNSAVSLKPSMTIRLLLMVLFVCLFANITVTAQISTLNAWSNVYHNTATTAQTVTYAIPTGSGTNRILVVAIASSQTATGTARVVTLTYGGQTLTSVNGDMATTTVRQHTQLYYLNEGGLDAATGTNLVFTVGGGSTRITDVFAAVYDGVDQATPITDSKTYSSGIATLSNPVFGSALTVNAYDQAVKIISSMRTASTTARTITNYATNWGLATTEQTSTATDAIRNAVANRSISTTNSTDVSSTTFSGTSLASMTGMSLKCAPTTPTITSLGLLSGCVGSSITINGTNLGTVTAANLKIGGTPVASITSNTGTQIVAVIGAGTTGLVTATNYWGTTATSIDTFTVNALTAITTQPATPAATCSGSGTQTMTVAAIGAGLTYTWKKDGINLVDGGAISGQGTATLTLTNALVADAGSYTVVVSGTCGPAVTSNPDTVTVSTESAVGSVSANQTICSGSALSSDITINSATGTVQWQKASDSGFTTGLTILGNNSTTLTIAQVGALTATTYFRAVVTSGACTLVTSATVMATVNPLPATPTISAIDPTTFCAGGSVTLTSSAASGNQWYKGGVLISGETGTTYNATTSGTYTVITNNGTCSSLVSTGTIVTVNLMPTATAGGTQTICQNSTSNATATVSGASSSNGTILWTENGIGSITSGSNGLTPTYTSAAGDAGNTVTLTMTVSNSPCTVATATYTITVNALPNIGLTVGGTATICTGSGTNITVASSVSGTTYQLRNGTTNIGSSVSGTGGTINLPTGNLTATTTFNVLATITATGCSSQLTQQETVTMNPLPVAAGTITGTATVCQGQAASAYSVSAITNATSYVWSYSGTGAMFSSTTIRNPTIAFSSDATSGVLTIYGVNTCGEIGTASTKSITVNPSPTVAANPSADQTIANGTTIAPITITSSATTYTWARTNGTATTGNLRGIAPSGTGSSISGTLTNTTTTVQTTIFTVTATSGGCSSIATVTVTVLPDFNISYHQSGNAASDLNTQTVIMGSCASVDGGNSNDADLWSGSSNITGTTYQWQSYTASQGWIDFGSAQTTVATVANSPILTSFVNTVGQYQFRLKVTIPSVPLTVYSDVLTLNVIDLAANQNNGSGGIITGDLAVCASSFTPAKFKETTPATGPPLDLTYQWEKSTTSSTTGFSSTGLPTTFEYQAPTITSGTVYYRRLVYYPSSCSTTATTPFLYSNVIAVSAGTPAAPGLVIATQPTCAVATGSFTITNYNDAYTYTITPNGGVTRSGNTVTAPAGSYTVTASLTTPTSCSSSPSTFTLNVQSGTLAPPTVSSITPPTCALATASVVLNLPAGTTLNQTIGTVTTSYTITGNPMTISDLAAGTYYFTVSSGTCSSTALSVPITAFVPVINTWTASGWSTGLPPTAEQKIVFDSTDIYYLTSDIVACSCQAKSDVTIKSGHNLTLTNELIVDDSVNMAFEDGASLVQIENVATNNNTGDIQYYRSTYSRKTDYNYLSSPVSPSLGALGPQTLGEIATDLSNGTFYSYKPTATGEDWEPESAGTIMVVGKGYIATRSSEIPQSNATIPKLELQFSGIPNNGHYEITPIYADKSYLLGNPYPSALDADTFLNENKDVLNGTLYFWTHNTAMKDRALLSANSAGSGAYAYTTDDYATYNATGGVAATNIDTGALTGSASSGNGSNIGGDNSQAPSGKIASGQGFFASTKIGITGNKIVFDNTMRLAGTTEQDGSGVNQQFFKTRSPNGKTAKTKAIEKNRIWLNMTNTEGAFKQTLVGYLTDATNDYDDRFDGESFDGNEFIDFYSLNQDLNLTIQGRALPFDEKDEVALGYRTTIDGAFTINIAQADGLLTNQAVFIEDKLTNTVTDLKNGNYTFNTAAGTFNERFVLKYSNKTLSVDATDKEDGILAFYSNNYKTLIIRNNLMDATVNSVALFNMLGQNIENWDVSESEQTNVQVPIKNITSGIYIVKVTTTKGESSKKIIVN